MKRFLALFLCFALCLTLLPAASAEDIEIVDEPAIEAPAPLDEIVIDAPGGPTDEIDALLDEPLIEPVGADAPGGPLDEIALIDEPDKTAPGADAEIQATLVASGECGDSLTWELVDDGNLFIRGSGAMTDYTRGTAPWYEYRAQIKELYVYSSTTTIGDYAFFGCYNLKLAADNGKSFPSSLTSIGQSAFLSCSSLEYVTIPSGVTSIGTQAFDYCSGMKRMTICGAPTLAYRSLGCANLEEISFLGGVPTFDSYIFRDTTAKAWYPPDNSAWTSDVLQNYGGTLTWQAGYHGWIGDDITWDLNASTGALSLSGSGTNWDFGSSGWQSWYPIRGKVQSAVVGSGITALREYALDYLYNMSSVSLPDTLTEIGWGVFFRDSSLSSIKIPKNVTAIGYDAFRGCSALTEVRFLGYAPESINTAAFGGVTATVYYFPVYSWTSSTMQQYGGTLTWSCDDKIGDDVTWYLAENGKLSITGTGATWDFNSATPNFHYFRSKVKTAEIGGGVTVLGKQLFWRMDALEIVVLGPDVETISNGAFVSCFALTEIRFQGEAPSIDPNCFNGVTATAYYLPLANGGWTSDVTQNYGGTITWVCDNQVGDNVFWTIDAAGTLSLTGTGSTWDYDYTNHPGFYYLYSAVKSLTVGEGITTIGEYLFYSMPGLSSVSLPDTLTTIETGAFYNCYSLTNLTIPNNVAYINWMAFAYCSGLKTVTFNGTPHFFQACFYQDTALTDIYFKYHAPDTIPTNTFYGAKATAYYYPVYSWTEDKMTQPDSGHITWVKDDKIGDDVTWYLAENGKLSITGTGETWDFIDGYSPAFCLYFSDEVKTAEIGAGVTGVGDFLFWIMDALEIVVLGPDVETIGAKAFSWCTKLTEIRFQGEAPSFGNNCFYRVTATAYYPIDDPTWTEDVMQDYGGDITWKPYGGYPVTVANYTKEKATTSLVPGLLYSGVITFTVSCDQAVVVAVRNGDEYTVIKCTTVGDEHRYTLPVGGNVELAIALKGDVNLDGAVKATDGTMIKRIAMKTYTPAGKLNELVSDVNGDGVIKATEGTMVSRAALNSYVIPW